MRTTLAYILALASLILGEEETSPSNIKETVVRPPKGRQQQFANFPSHEPQVTEARVEALHNPWIGQPPSSTWNVVFHEEPKRQQQQQVVEATTPRHSTVTFRADEASILTLTQDRVVTQPSSEWVVSPSEKTPAELEQGNFVIRPSRPETKPHLRVLSFSLGDEQDSEEKEEETVQEANVNKKNKFRWNKMKKNRKSTTWEKFQEKKRRERNTVSNSNQNTQWNSNQYALVRKVPTSNEILITGDQSNEEQNPGWLFELAPKKEEQINLAPKENKPNLVIATPTTPIPAFATAAQPQLARRPQPTISSLRRRNPRKQFKWKQPEVKQERQIEPKEIASVTPSPLRTATIGYVGPEVEKRKRNIPKAQRFTRKKSNNIDIPIVKQVGNVQQDGDRRFNYEFEGANGIKRTEEGFLKNMDSENPIQVIRGSYSYTGPDGKIYTINYIADEKGFRASGDHLPA